MASYLSKQGGDEKPTPSSTETGQRDYSQHARALIATNQISAHISLVTMGIVPSIESHEVSTAIRDYAKFSEDEMLAGTSHCILTPSKILHRCYRHRDHLFCSHYSTNSIDKHTNAATPTRRLRVRLDVSPAPCDITPLAPSQLQNSEPSRSTRNHRKTPRTPRERRLRCPKSRTPR